MKVLLAGATGALGALLVPALIHAGHDVTGITRSSEAAERLRARGADAVVADVLDREGLLAAIRPGSADAVVHQLTALKRAPFRQRDMEQTNRLRTEGSTNLLDAAEKAGAHRFLTQSMFFGYGYRDHGSTPLTEESTFGRPDGGRNDPIVEAMGSAEQQAFRRDGIEGIALRYGLFYGADESLVPLLRKRGVPVASWEGDLAFIHHADAADATVAALERGRAGEAYNIVDDEPATWAEYVRRAAASVEAPEPRRYPAWLVRIVAPYAGDMMSRVNVRVSNEKARRDLGWSPSFPSIREGLSL